MSEVFWRDLSSGRYHRAHRIGDNVATLEADNLDQAGEHEIFEVLPESVEPESLCERCFPDRPGR